MKISQLLGGGFLLNPFLFILIACLALFMPYLGGMHLFDWDEINFAACAKEMIVRNDFFTITIDYKPFWEKPPLFIWMQVLAMKIFGINEFSSRLPNAIGSLFSSITLFAIGSSLKNKTFGGLWVLSYLCSILPHLYFRSGIIDPWFNYLLFCAIYAYYRLGQSPLFFTKLCWGGGCVILLTLASLTKGPVALALFTILMTGISVFQFRKYLLSTKLILSILQIKIIILGAIGLFGIWFVMDYLANGACLKLDTKHLSEVLPQKIFSNINSILSECPCSLAEFLEYHARLFGHKDAGHGGFIGYHFIVLFLGCFPASVFALDYIILKKENKECFSSLWNVLMWALLILVLIVFSIVKTKIVHYSSLAYFPLTYFASLRLYDILMSGKKILRYEMVLFKVIRIILGILLFILTIFIALLPYLKPYLNEIINDPFALHNLEASVNWNGMQFIPLIIFGIFMYSKDLINQFIISGILIMSIIYTIVPNIEAYTQRANIEFFKSLKTINKGKSFYVTTLDYKSYAPYFYADFQPPTNINYFKSNFKEWLLTGNIDRNAYFSVKINKAMDYKTDFYLQRGVQELYRKNGFVFFKRNKS